MPIKKDLRSFPSYSIVKKQLTNNLNQNINNKKLVKSNNYLKTYLFLLTTFFALVGSTNYLINPHKVFNSRNIFALKNQTFNITNWTSFSRYHKANHLNTGKYDTLFLGNSRVFGGLDPRNSSLSQHSVYNAGLPHANIYEIEKIFNYARSRNKLDKVIIGLDLGQFSEKRDVSGDFDRSLFAGKIPYFVSYYSNLFSITHFFDSLEIIQHNFKNEIAQNSEPQIVDGFNIRQSNYQQKKPQKQFINYARSFTSNENYLDFNYTQERINILRKIITECRQEEIEIQLFISPVHAWQLEFMEASKIFSLFESWKKDLVDLIAEDALKNADKSPIFLWDFSGYNIITTEPVPSNSKTQMQWFNDPSHYKKEVGDIVLNIIAKNGQQRSESDRYSMYQAQGFGKLINQANIETHLLEIRQQQKIYQNNHAKDIQIIQEIAAQNETRSR